MDEIFQAVYKQGVLTPLQDPGLQEQQVVHLHVVPAQVRIGACVYAHAAANGQPQL